MTRTERLARRLGLDSNPLRRRTDRIAGCLGAGLLAAFLIGAPLLSIASARGRAAGGALVAGDPGRPAAQRAGTRRLRRRSLRRHLGAGQVDRTRWAGAQR